MMDWRALPAVLFGIVLFWAAVAFVFGVLAAPALIGLYEVLF